MIYLVSVSINGNTLVLEFTTEVERTGFIDDLTPLGLSYETSEQPIVFH